MSSNMSRKLISFASIVPGLGLWLLGYRKTGLFSFLLVLVSLFVAFSVDLDVVTDLAGTITLVAWITQFYTTKYTLRIKKELESGIGKPPPLKSDSRTTMSIPPNIRRFSRGMYKSVQELLEPGETMKHVAGNTTNIISLTDKRLILITKDIFGKPAVLYPYAIGDVKSASLMLGLLNDILAFDFGLRGEASVSVSRGFRSETRAIMDQITSGNSPVNPD